MEVVSHDVVENILERVPVKSLVRFKSVSKQWKSTIESKNFQERRLFHRQQSPDPDVLLMTFRDQYSYDYGDDTDQAIPLSLSFSVDDEDDHTKIISASLVTLGKVRIKKRFGCSTSCDGLVCLYNEYKIIMINPATRWHRTLPLSNLQKHRSSQLVRNVFGPGMLGFGKDKVNGTYKSVWLYNNIREFGNMKTITTCEVFDFRINAWRYVRAPASPYKIITYISPVYLDGSLHWLTKSESETEVLSFDLHTETFQVIAKAPFHGAARYHYKMCNLNNRLCVSEAKWPNQVIWMFDSGRKTWNHMCSIDLKMTYSWFRKSTIHQITWNSGRCIGGRALKPLAVLEKNEKTKVLFHFYIQNESGHFVIYDSQTKSYDFAFNAFENYYGDPICYFQSLISIL